MSKIGILPIIGCVESGKAILNETVLSTMLAVSVRSFHSMLFGLGDCRIFFPAKMAQSP